MALRAPAISQPKIEQTQRVPAVASYAIRNLIDGPLRPGRVLGTSRVAVWIAVGDPVEGDACIVVGTSDAVRLPNSLTITQTSDARPFDTIDAQRPAIIGDGSVQFDRIRVDRARCWDPRPTLRPTTADALIARLLELSRRFEPDHDPLGAALAAGNVEASTAIALDRLGGGPGLTPYEDDVISGALAAMALLGEALGCTAATRTRTFIHDIGDAVCPIAWHRTTTLSAALLRHAVNGEVAAPVAAVLRALTGDGDVSRTTDDLLRVGHSSGLGLTKGVLIGAHGALAMGRMS